MSTIAPNLSLALGGIYATLLASSALAAAVRLMRPSFDLTEIRLRIRSWWVMAVVFTVALLLHPVVSVGFFAVLSALAVREYLRLLPAEDRRVGLVAYPALVAQYALVAVGRLDLVVMVAIATALAVPAVLAVRGRTAGFAAATGSVLVGVFLTVFSLGHAAFLMVLPAAADAPAGAAGLLVFLVVLTQANDVAQFVWGKALGRRRIAPQVSPGKTAEGLIGGVLTTTALAAAATPLLAPFSIAVGAGVGLMIGVAGFVGDITMSAVKRDAGVKDSGSLLPGHGGVLDRIDSLIFTAPLFFHLFRLIGG